LVTKILMPFALPSDLASRYCCSLAKLDIPTA
jgi:hypothetical protein